MKIALAHDWLTNWAGSEQLLFYLHRTFKESPIYTTLYEGNKIKKIPKRLVRTSWLQNIPGASKHHQLFIPLMPLAIRWDMSDFDLVISDCSWAMKGLKLPKRTKHIAIILTPTRWLWGFGQDKRREVESLSRLPLIIKKLKSWDLEAAKRPDVLVAISKTVQKRIWQIYRRQSTVIYPPVEVGRFKPLSEKSVESYYLSVGRLVSYKRVDLIVDAFNQLGWPLKIVGTGPEEAMLKSIAGRNVQFLGSLSDERRDEVIRRARGLVFAADEDFGIVPVEAMAAGRPVIAFGRGGATETVKEGVSGTFFSEQTVESLVDALERTRKMKFDPQVVSQSVQQFNPKRFQQEIRELVKSRL